MTIRGPQILNVHKELNKVFVLPRDWLNSICWRFPCLFVCSEVKCPVVIKPAGFIHYERTNHVRLSVQAASRL